MNDDRENVENLISGYSALTKDINKSIRYPDINHYNEKEIKEFLSTHCFSQDEINTILNSKNKTAAYQKIRATRNSMDSYNIFTMYSKYFEDNKNFLTPELQTEIESISDSIWQNWVSNTFIVSK